MIISGSWLDLWLASLLWTRICFADDLIIGGIFRTKDSLEERAFKSAIDEINRNSSLLPNNDIKYVASVSGILSKFDTIQKVKASNPMCNGFHVPMITPSATDPTLSRKRFYKYLLRMMSSDTVQTSVIVNLIRYFRWDTLAVLADSTDYGIYGLIQLQTAASKSHLRVLAVQRFSAFENAFQTNATEQLLSIRGSGARVVVLYSLAEHAVYVLEQAHQLGMMESGWAWITTDGISGFNDMPQLANERPYLNGIVGIRPAADEATIEAFYRDLLNVSDFQAMPVWPLLYYDSVYVYAHAMHQLLENDAYILQNARHDCLGPTVTVWRQGAVVYRYLTQVKMRGLMREFQFDKRGSPKNGLYDIVALEGQSWKTYGRWSETEGLTLNATELKSVGNVPMYDVRDYVGDLANKTLRVLVIIDPPFVFKRDKHNASDDAVCGPLGCYYGYAIDLLKKLANNLEFSFTISEVKDNKYGSKDYISNTWNGIIGELLRDENNQPKADLAIGAITITSERQSVVSFTKPYRDLQRGILIASQDETYNPLSFLTPLTYDLWMLTFGTACVVGLFITCVDKMSPYGHHGIKAQIDSEYASEAMDTNEDGSVDYWELKDWYSERNTMNLVNAIFWSLASLFQQGGERHPKSWSARVAAATWWVGILIITSSYTANLAAFLTIKTPSHTIDSVEDLLRTSSVQYGTVADSEVQHFMDTASRSPYSDLRKKMNGWGLFFETAEEAVNYTIRSRGNFAFLYDLPTLEYWKGHNCTLKVAKYGFSSVGYGFVLPKHSQFTKELTIEIYRYRESGIIDALDKKWLKPTSTGCSSSNTVTDNREEVTVYMTSVWGVFWIIYAGFAVSLTLAVVEWFLSAMMAVNRNDEKAPHSFADSVRRQLKAFKNDFLENWFVNFHRTEIKRRERELRPLKATMRAAVMLKIRASRVSHSRSPGEDDREGHGESDLKDMDSVIN
ncbi:hypothetical protein LSH36_796g00020 [Paralvinella palmiformis]|uniref:Uncharacterized protein n=1 Tax=Paralvinella palmiformis TaxID=53620 RepID=A0AAD9MUZ5_9ANNE|nr:hypothetical protein LSH36_796g00020 [Paralvinella palmiformis]